MVWYTKRGTAKAILLALAVIAAATLAGVKDGSTLFFACAFALRYIRLIVHCIFFWAYRPAPESLNPLYSEKDVTVILPTVDPHKYLARCLDSIVANRPSKIFVVTAGRQLEQETRQVVADWLDGYREPILDTKVSVTAIAQPNKRRQVAHVIKMVTTRFIVGADDSVVWPSTSFLRSVLDAFEENPRVGLVGTNKRVFRDFRGSFLEQFWNFIGCIYLARHNFEFRATNAANGGVMVVSGRTLGIRTSIAQRLDFLQGYVDETFLGQLLLPDDDNYIHRYIVNHNWDIKFQYTEDARVETSLGTFPRFLKQCLRWARTTFRSNPVLLAGTATWYRHPWTNFATILTGLVNFALFVDPFLVYLLTQSSLYQESRTPWALVSALIAWILASKLVKLIPHFILYPGDIVFFPGYVLFAYFHSLLKLYALLTAWDVSWSGRQLDQVTESEDETNSTDGQPWMADL